MEDQIKIEHLRRLADLYRLEEFTDEKWFKMWKEKKSQDWFGSLEGPRNWDEKFLAVLCWLGGNEWGMWESIRDKYRKMGSPPLACLNIDELFRGLNHRYVYIENNEAKGWPVDWLKRLRDYLTTRGITMEEFSNELRVEGQQDPATVVKKLQSILRTSETKIIGCFMRDYLEVDAFPIDFHVRKVLEAYGLPIDMLQIMKLCKEAKIPIRPFARALYYCDKFFEDIRYTGGKFR